MHKLAGDIVRGDQFLMAGGHFVILGVYEIDDEDMIKVKFISTNYTHGRRCYLTLPKAMLLSLHSSNS